MAKEQQMPLGRRNYLMMLAGIGAIVIGFVLLSGGGSDDPAVEFDYGMFNFRRLYVAPVLLLAGFLFEIYAIMYRPKGTAEQSAARKTE